ncbi:FYVE like protein [Argiope bruennichi]|uniref:FYVE like protein n=1 Tax=Argiope bruennichi TaxID=94029 RepID=A0A8T0EZ52_ARGBR|nr:FYVE like protein [Argiope bruennichi]
MDAANDQISTNKPPLLPKPCLSTSSSEHGEHVIPQMVITSPDEEPAVIQNSSQAIPLPYVPLSEPISTDSQAKDLKGIPSPPEAVQEQQPEDGKWSGDGQVDITQNKPIPQSHTESKPEEHVSHSVIQRPLIIESEKFVSQSTTPEPNVQISESPSPPPSLPPTTMQRPLVVDNSKTMHRENIGRDINEEILDDFIEPSIVDTKPKSSSFSWMPSFSKPHSSGKDEKSTSIQSSKKETDTKDNKPSDIEPHAKKDGIQQNMKKFFDNLLHDTTTDTKDKTIVHDDQYENAAADSKNVQKDGKHGVMKLFSSSKQESETKGKKSPLPGELPKETSNIKETSKDSKFTVKKMFDSFKHDTSDKKDAAAELSQPDLKSKGKVMPSSQEPPKEVEVAPKDFSKDSRFNVKKIFQHDTTEKKDATEIVKPDTKLKGKISATSTEPVKDLEPTSKDVSKESKFSVKKMLDSFKHDAAAEKREILPESSTDVKVKVEITPSVESEAKSKDSKFNMKKMFDSFKHDSSEKKDILPDSSTDLKPKEKSTSPTKITKEGDVSSKISKMFDSFKHDSPQKKTDVPSDLSQPNENLSKPHKEGDSSSKYNISKMFDSFKHDSSQKKTDILSESSQIVENPDASKVHKDSKTGFKKFIDSFKHDETASSTTAELKESETPLGCSEYGKKDNLKSAISKPDISKQYPGKETTSQVTITISPSETIDTQSKIATETKELPEGKLKSKEGSVKKFFHSFKFEGAGVPTKKTAKHHVTFLERDSLKRSHSFRDSILLKDEDVPDHTEKVSKGSAHSIRKLFTSDKPSEKKKLKSTLKRSESCKETFAEKEAFHGFRSFFDSITHKNVPKSSQVSNAEEHIYDTVGKPEPSTSSPSYPENISRQTSSKTPEPKQKDDSSGMKKLFDSFRHKDSASKPKVTKREDKDYEKIDISFAVPSTSETSRPLSDKKKEQITTDLKKEPQPTKIVETKKKEQIIKDTKKESEPIKIVETKKKEQTTKDMKKESQPIKSVEIQKPKDVPKVSSLSPKLTKEKKAEETIPSIQINGPSTSVDSKTSMFTTISDNFTVLKDKVMHPKDSKKKEATDQEKVSEEYDLQHAASKNQIHDISAGTYKPIEDGSFISVDLKQEDDIKKGTTSVIPDNKIPSQEKSLQESMKKPSIPKHLQKSDKVSAKIEPGTPETLYDTCCMRLANLLGKKALEIVSEKTKGPPKKPPKPSAEAIARARAAVVSQRLRGHPAKVQSIGENIPPGYDGIRFADDETESSCDYKDVENIDYILDYELVNRYKCDSKLDTFSDPSTCSGMSSYYTPDTVTLKDETFSDAPFETVNLNNDYLFQHLSAAANEPDFRSLPSKVKSKEERDKLKFIAKPGQSVSSTTLTPVKKVPPPLPPKPTVLPKPKDIQNKDGVSQCINGLSLSPRLKTKFEKDSAATKKRPLLVADLKGTEFTSLQTKSKEHQNKERTFNTVLRNESLKNISTIAPLHKPLQNTKSSPHISQASASFEPTVSKKQTPQRPPPPISSIHSEEKRSKAPPPVPEKPKREGRTASTSAIPEKRTISPPRPPPPVITKVNVPPPRPPPPTPSKIVTELSDQRIGDQSETSNILKTDQRISQKDLSNDIPIYENDSQQHKLSDIIHPDSSEKKESIDDNQSECKPDENLNVSVKESNLTPKFSEVISEIEVSNLPSVSDDTDVIKPAPKPPPRGRRIRSRTVEIPPKEKTPEKSLRRSQSLSDIEVETRTSHLTISTTPTKADLKHLYTSVNKDGKRAVASGSQSPSVSSRPLPAPPPPPRKFRSLDRKPKDRKKQAEKDELNSSECDVHRSASADAAVDQGPKDTENLIESTLETSGSLSPLPRSCSPDLSLDHESKDELREIDSFKLSESGSPGPRNDSPNISVKPPERRRKTDKQRFLSLHTEKKKTIPEFETYSLRMPRSHSEPLKPDRKFKHVHRPEYDENANISFPTVAEVHYNNVILDECGNEIGETSASANIPSVDATDSTAECSQDKKSPNPHPRRKKDKNPKKSHSSWYDQSEESWEIVDWDSVAASEKGLRTPDASGALSQMRRRSDPIIGRKIRQTSKFYVDVEVGNSGLPLVDKETSPLHLDCSEKSVQTSLETLSQGIISRDEQSELAESSSDNTDNLLNIVKTLQSELKTTLSRHKSLGDEDNDTSNATTDTEKKDEDKKKYLKTPSIQSSASETWPISSSDESEGELSPGRAANLSEIALNRKKKKVFYIAREIMTSEEIFVDTLKLLNVDFKAAVEAASKQRNVSVVPDEVLSQILNHLPQLQQLNENLLMELKDRIDNWDKLGKIADVIVKIGPFLKLYSWYIHDFESNVALLEESKKKYPTFAQVVKEFESSSRCKRLALNHFMLKPIQRIPQYRLLLQEYLHHLTEDSPDYQDTVTALQIVSEVAGHANDSMKQGDNAQKLISIQNSIMGHKEIIKPGRLFVKEGELMKLSRKGMQPRWFVLFNDLLLYLTPVQHGLYRINHELPLTGMKVAIPIQQDYQNEFSIISVTRSFTLAARSQEERQEWIVALTKAIEENASKRSTFTNIRLQKRMQGRNSEDDEGDFVLGRKAPVWIPDARVTMCQLCTSEFTVTFRRHHCRACGKVICSVCSSNRIPLAYLGGNKVYRVCDECYSKLGPETGSTPENGETDSDNQQIAVKPHLRTEHRYTKKGKRNLPSVLKEVCANDQGSTISGYLQKRIGKSWKKEWFVVKDKVLYEYKASEDVAALSSTPLLGYQIESFSEDYENVNMSLLFQLTHPGQAPIIFHTDSIGSTERWIAALKEASVLE